MQKLSLKQIYERMQRLQDEHAWVINTYYDSKNYEDSKRTYQAKSFATPFKGPAIWILSGIHGEEPAGPNAIARSVDFLGKINPKIPLVIFPVCNPKGYSRSWRYPNQKTWHPDSPNISVGDSEHYLIDPNNPNTPRQQNPSCIESRKLIGEILRLKRTYPVSICLDLHEDELINKGYIYSYGTNEDLRKYLGNKLLETLKKAKIPIKSSGKTRFNEEVKKGVVLGTSNDGSIEELFSSEKLILRGKKIKGPCAEACFVIETPASALTLEQRVTAHSAVLRLIQEL